MTDITDILSRARAALVPPVEQPRPLATLAAAALAAGSAMLMAGMVIVGPGFSVS
ncbi:peptidoglycan-binding protein [Brevundimonas sp.]|uniref:peptidoglycan-binding protein n=1 Tax=Brevundimonas sp. TaxID=1871086 RepID=UPI002AB9B6F6|nr:peptidoglycan-binding protein [Brevundimonas sp.]MDZ4362681.1 peptidoglycan-binding protein [Brevundimonas sp.]